MTGRFEDTLLSVTSIYFYFTIIIICGTGVWTQGLHLTLSTSPFLWWVLSRYGLMNYLPGWLWTTIFLISVSWVAKITGVNHRLSLQFLCVSFLRSWSLNLGPQASITWAMLPSVLLYLFIYFQIGSCSFCGGWSQTSILLPLLPTLLGL
jgi:hypothetical protein